MKIAQPYLRNDVQANNELADTHMIVKTINDIITQFDNECNKSRPTMKMMLPSQYQTKK